MKKQDQLKFRELQVIFFVGMSEYPNDKERMEKGLQILEKFIDDLVTRECSALFSINTKLKVTPGSEGSGKLIN
jgi:hypothetical protein